MNPLTTFVAGLLSGGVAWSFIAPELHRRARKAKRAVKSVFGPTRVATTKGRRR